MVSFFTVLLYGTATWLAYGLYLLAKRSLRRIGRRYPPGPPGLPLLGNLKLPSELSWKVYRTWGEKYGSDILYFNALGNDIVIVNTLDASKELLERRSAIYSDRPTNGLTMLKDLCGLDWTFGLQQYGPEWRDGRKAFHREFTANAVKRFRPVETREAHKLLRRLLHTPHDFMSHVRKVTGSSIITIAYGIETLEEDDPYVATAEDVMVAVGESMLPGTFLVNLFPILKYVPEWFPGATFQTKARAWRHSVERTLNAPWEAVRERMVTDPTGGPDSVAKSLIEETVETANDSGYTEHIAKAVTASMYLGGSDTSLSILQSFFLAMVIYPDVQRRAQESIDAVCKGRLPDFSDIDSLPYIDALVKESLRWHPVGALNIPHRCREDDIYQGYYIPKGSTVIANIWAILHDSEVYQDPESFVPERFLKHRDSHESPWTLDTDILDPVDVAFGFGRRICPGKNMAYESMWITIASVLAVFNLEQAKDENGQPIVPPEAYCDGFVSRPMPFPCSIVPRSPDHEALILKAQERS